MCLNEIDAICEFICGFYYLFVYRISMNSSLLLYNWGYLIKNNFLRNFVNWILVYFINNEFSLLLRGRSLICTLCWLLSFYISIFIFIILTFIVFIEFCFFWNLLKVCKIISIFNTLVVTHLLDFMGYHLLGKYFVFLHLFYWIILRRVVTFSGSNSIP